MLKKVNLDIESYLENLDEYGMPEGEPETAFSSFIGTMKIFGSEISLSYKEMTENGSVSCSITQCGESVTVRRIGAIASVMVFDIKQPFQTLYSIPPYKFDMLIKTKELTAVLNENGGEINILYDMDIGGMKRSARMKITAKEV